MIKYSPLFDTISQEEEFLLHKCLKSVQTFVRNSKKISGTNYATRDAHSKTYAVLQGNLMMEENLPQFVSKIFSGKNYEVIARLSHANPVISHSKKENPAFGFALKIKNIGGTDANFPLANFPLFPMKSVSGFLKFFTSLNTFLVTKADNFVVSAMDLPHLFRNSAGLLPNLLSFDLARNFAKILNSKNAFILSFDFHSIGVYRLGDYLMKLKLVPHYRHTDFEKNLDQKSRTANYIHSTNADFALMIQLCENLKKQPVNDLTKEWKDAPFLKIATLNFAQDSLLDANDPQIENMGFNPFENPESLLPVGKMQQIRKSVYETSIRTRNEINAI